MKPEQQQEKMKTIVGERENVHYFDRQIIAKTWQGYERDWFTC